MKMNFIFKIESGWRPLGSGFLRPAVVLAALLSALPACQRPTPSSELEGVTRDGGDAQRLVTILDYVGSDYAMAVEGGRILSQLEYDEQLKFTADARSLARSVLGEATPDSDPLLAQLADLEAQVKARAEPLAVARACRAARDETVARFSLRTRPTTRPSLARAQVLYAESCAVCHGENGDAETPRARTLDPRPARFRDPERLGALSPYRVYNTLTFGVPGTAMASFDSYSAEDRWNLAFYVFRLGHHGESGRGPVTLSLADLAFRSDQEIRDSLRAAGHPAPEEGVVHARLESAFAEPPAGLGIDRTRRLLARAEDLAAQGKLQDADRVVLDAYLEGFEPLEPRLRGRDAAGTLAVETGFRDLRAALTGGKLAEVRTQRANLDSRLAQLSGGKGAVPLLAALLIYFREGVEAALLVGALLAGVRRLGRSEASRYVHLGWMLALPAGLATWWVSERLIRVTATQRELSEAVIALVAAAVLFSMSFWMISKVEARRWTGYLRRGLEETLTRRNLRLLAGLSFLAVYREAAETVLFTQALLLDHQGARGQVWLGAALGLLVVVVVALVMSRTVMRLPLGPFFAVSSALLCALAISFAGSGMYELVAAGYLSPRPVPFPEIPWMGIHPDLTALLLQLLILTVIGAGAIVTLRKSHRPAPHGDAPGGPAPAA